MSKSPERRGPSTPEPGPTLEASAAPPVASQELTSARGFGAVVKRFGRVGIGVLVGGGIGLGYYALVGCSTGSCAITSSPTVSLAYGALVGALMTIR